MRAALLTCKPVWPEFGSVQTMAWENPNTLLHTRTAELDYPDNAKMCSYNARGQWQIRLSSREGRKTALWAVIDRCQRLAVRLNLPVTVDGGLGHHRLLGQPGWGSTNTHATGKDRPAGIKRSRRRASCRRCVARWAEWIRSCEEGSWCGSRRWRQHESVHVGKVLWLVNFIQQVSVRKMLFSI